MNFDNDPWVADIVQQFRMHADEEDLGDGDREELAAELADQVQREADGG